MTTPEPTVSIPLPDKECVVPPPQPLSDWLRTHSSPSLLDEETSHLKRRKGGKGGEFDSESDQVPDTSNVHAEPPADWANLDRTDKTVEVRPTAAELDGLAEHCDRVLAHHMSVDHLGERHATASTPSPPRLFRASSEIQLPRVRGAGLAGVASFGTLPMCAKTAHTFFCQFREEKTWKGIRILYDLFTEEGTIGLCWGKLPSAHWTGRVFSGRRGDKPAMIAFLRCGLRERDFALMDEQRREIGRVAFQAQRWDCHCQTEEFPRPPMILFGSIVGQRVIIQEAVSKIKIALVQREEDGYVARIAPLLKPVHALLFAFAAYHYFGRK